MLSSEFKNKKTKALETKKIEWRDKNENAADAEYNTTPRNKARVNSKHIIVTVMRERTKKKQDTVYNEG